MSEYTDNQIRAIRRIQGLSYNDPDFQKNMASNLTFKEVVSCGLWSLAELERMGESIIRNSERRERSYTFYICSGRRHPRRKMQRIASKEQLSDKRRSLNKYRDKPIRRSI